MDKRAAFFSPAFRSRRFGYRQLRALHILKIGLITLVAPAAVMAVIGLPFLVLGSYTNNETLLALGSFTGLAVMSPFIGIYAVPVALLLGAWAMRFGIAGWGVAVLVTGLFPTAIGILFQLLDPTAAAVGAMLILTPVVVLHGVVLWCATRWICPDALLSPPTA